MMKINFYIIIFTLCLILIVSSCNSKCTVNDVEVSELLKNVAKEESFDYCGLLKKSFDGNENAIKELSLLKFENAVGYDHGAVIVDLITKVGETKYIEAISTANREEKNLINSYLDVGLEYGSNSVVEGKDLKSAFPKLYSFLND